MTDAMQPEAVAPQRRPLELCSSCGVVRIHGKASCARCHAAHPAEPLHAPPGSSLVWACVECTFKCRACGFVVPLDRLDTTGAVECAHCGLEQAFEVKAWHEALDHAHGVADCMVDGVGTAKVSAQETIRRDNSFQITASPGYPLCKSCHGLLDVSVADGHRATVTCAACKTSEVYEIPATAVRLTSKALSALIATDHRADRQAARVERTPGAIAVTCPSCNAPLEVGEGMTFVQCKFCHATCRIPASVRVGKGGKPPRPEAMWMGFDGPSRLRHEAEQAKAKRAHDAQLREKKQEAAAQETHDAQASGPQPALHGAAWQDPAPAPQVAPAAPMAPVAPMVPTAPPPPAPARVASLAMPAKASGRSTGIAIVVIVAVLVVVGVVAAVVLLAPSTSPAPSPSRPPPRKTGH